MRQDVDAALDGGLGAGAVRRMRDHERSPLVRRFRRGPDDVGVHDDHGVRRGHAPGEELDPVGPGLERHHHFLVRLGRRLQRGESNGPDVERTAAWRDEASARDADIGTGECSLHNAPAQTRGAPEPRAGIEDMHEPIAGEHVADLTGGDEPGKPPGRGEAPRHEVHVTVPEAGRQG
jgi:hypothetical protein